MQSGFGSRKQKMPNPYFVAAFNAAIFTTVSIGISNFSTRFPIPYKTGWLEKRVKRGVSDMKKKLIVVADDFGFSEAYNYGVIKAYKEGIVTVLSLMSNSLFIAVLCCRNNIPGTFLILPILRLPTAGTVKGGF